MAQPTKRRRIDPAAALSKPFKSPLRRPANTEVPPSTPTPKAQVSSPTIPEATDVVSSTPNAIPATPVPTERKPRKYPPSTPKPFQPPDPEIIALQKQQRAIQSRLATLRSEIDQAKQALRLETSNKDTELEALIVKWRLISQNAADEAFIGAQERVKRMGGMAAWKENSKRDATRWEFDEERREVEHVDEEEVDSGEIEDPKNGLGDSDDVEEIITSVPAFPFYMSRPTHRDIACARCFRLKRKCDHAKPSCSECRRKGAECLPARSRKAGDSITIPLSYLKQLETQVAELDARKNIAKTDTCDAGVQTDFNLDFESRQLASPDIIAHNSPYEWQLSNPKSWQLPRSWSPDAFSLLPESPFDLPWLDMTPLYTLGSDDTPWLNELYANMYFSVTHREWPFLDETIWKSWHSQGIPAGQDAWRVFFLQMVYAIGASLSSTLQRDPSHSARSKEFYTMAMRFYPHVVGHPSMLLQIQASLLMILYALHSPSSEEITTSVSSVLPFCVATMAEIRKHASISRENGSVTGIDDVLLEKMFITCYMLNEVIVSGWDRPVSAAYRVVDDDMRTLGDNLQPALDIDPALSHLFRLRKIQANMRRSREIQSCEDLVDIKSRRSLFKPALDSWRQDIPQNALTNVQCGYLHPVWMQKLYDYSLLILAEETKNFEEMDEIKDTLLAIVDVCHNFRMLQEEGQVMCYTWSALVFQFRAGIMLLYIVWMTKSTADSRDRQAQQTAQEAISTCETNLNAFVHRWPDAMPYMRVFEFLQQRVGDGLGLESTTPVLLEEAELHLEQLKKKYLHRAVLAMIEEIMYGGRVQEELLGSDFMGLVEGERA
ncbi:unnamed protein product [Penicillium salamii]|nr:unnamed protein product [Penicillium salamii]